MEKRAWPNLNINKIINYAAIGLIAATLVIQQVRTRAPERVAIQNPFQAAEPAEAQTVSKPNPVKLLKLNLSLSSPNDLKVKQGDTVKAGEVLATRAEEQLSLSAERQALTLEYQQLQSRTIPTPPAPATVPSVNQLPPISYAEEEAAIASAETNARQTERAFQLQQQNLKTAPLEESGAVARAAVEVENRQRLVDNQKRKIDAVAMLKDLPDNVAAHEQEVLKQKEGDLRQAEADYKQAQGKLSIASQAGTEKLASLADALEKARADQQLAIAKLQTKRDQRAHTEYEASVTAARRTEERNLAASNYSRQILEAEQQQRERSFQLAQIKAKITEVNNKLSLTSIVTSPYDGLIKKIKIQKQTDNKLSAELVLAVSGVPATAPGSSSGNNTSTAAEGEPLASPNSTVH